MQTPQSQESPSVTLMLSTHKQKRADGWQRKQVRRSSDPTAGTNSSMSTLKPLTKQTNKQTNNGMGLAELEIKA